MRQVRELTKTTLNLTESTTVLDVNVLRRSGADEPLVGRLSFGLLALI
jgi:hypothetical protein